MVCNLSSGRNAERFGVLPTRAEVFAGRTLAQANVIEGLMPAAFHKDHQYESNRREVDHGRLNSGLRLMLGMMRDRTASGVIGGRANTWSLRRGHCELGLSQFRPMGLSRFGRIPFRNERVGPAQCPARARLIREAVGPATDPGQAGMLLERQ